MKPLPLLVPNGRGTWILDGQGGLTQAEFLRRVHALAAVLPSRRHAIMLTRGRGEFLIGFCAALVRGQTALLPVNDTEVAVDELAARYPDCYVMLDRPRTVTLDTVDISASTAAHGNCEQVPAVPADRVAAILQTSGSTGAPQSHQKTWGEMVAGAHRWRERFSIDASDYMVATVPAQHMFGFEASVMLPLQTGAAVFGAQPFYPADVADVLGRAHGATLVTTPVHLRACERVDIEWPSVRRIICSTASLDTRLAEACEARMQTEVCEIFGSTETGAIASRRTAADQHWNCLGGLDIEMRKAGAYIRGVATDEALRLNDEIDLIDAQTFDLLGRPTDMIKIAGKRASLADLNQRLNRIKGVTDGVLLCQRGQSADVDRLVALVVAPTLTPQQIRAELTRQVDPAFLPRRVIQIDELPRSATGKLSDHAARALLDSLNTQ